MWKRFTISQVKKKLRSLNSNILILGKYRNSGTPLPCICKVCGFKWSPRWRDLSRVRRGAGCPKCSGCARLSTEEVRRRLKEVSPDIKILGEYRGNQKPLKCLCRVCGFKWSPTWNDLSRGYGCHLCGGVKRQTLSEIRKKLREKRNDIRIVGGEYKNARSTLQCLCLTCGNKWKSYWVKLNGGCGCPKCAIVKPKGASEERVRSVVEKVTGWRFPRARPDFLNGMELDGFNSKNKLAFEYQGQHHYLSIYGLRALRMVKRNDNRKRCLCRYHGVRLFSVPYWVKDIEPFVKRKIAQLC